MWMRLLWACAVCWTLATAHAQEGPTPLILEEARGVLPLDGQLDWLEDRQGGQSLEAVRQSAAWQRLPGKLDVGFTPSAIWVRLTVRQPLGAPAEWIFFVDAAQVDEAVLHAPANLIAGPTQRAGRLVPHVSWPMDTRTPAFRIKLPPGEHQLYLRLKSEHTLSNGISLMSADAFRRHERREALFFGAFFGVIGVALALQLLFNNALRQSPSHGYLIYTAALALTALLSSGYLQAFVFHDRPMPVAWMSLIFPLALLALARMSATWLELRRVMPRPSQWYQLGLLTLALAGGGLILTQHVQEGVQLTQVVFALHTVASWLLSIHLWRKGSSQAGSYVVIFGLVEAGILVRFARNVGWLPVNLFTDYASFQAIALHLLAMSIYLITRFTNLKEALAIEQRTRAEQREFVDLVSHEFKTPLAIIHTSVQQLSANLDAPKEKIQQRAHNIRQAVHRMDRLLDQYLSVERLDAAHQPTRLQGTDFFEVIEEAVSDWPLERIRLTVGDLPTPFVCDPDLMRIVLRNLLENADRHSPADARIDLSVQAAPDGALKIQVKDQGSGIPPDELPQLFHKFFRGRASQGTPGAGLGLYLVARIIAAHRGQISVNSTAGQGTCFTIHLPGMKS